MSENLNNLVEMDKIYGDAYIKINHSKDEIEWKLDSAAVARKFGMTTKKKKIIKVQYSRLGQQWAMTAGTSTGLIGIIIVVAIFAGSGIYYKLKKRKMETENKQD